MPLWKKNSQLANNKPKYLHANTDPFYPASHCEGVTVADAHAANGLLTSGWTQFHPINSGNVVSISVTAGGSGYTNTSAVTITGADGNGTGATATVTADANGTITAVTLTANGAGYTVPPLVSVANGTGAEFLVKTNAKFRAEPLVAMSSMNS